MGCVKAVEKFTIQYNWRFHWVLTIMWYGRLLEAHGIPLTGTPAQFPERVWDMTMSEMKMSANDGTEYDNWVVAAWKVLSVLCYTNRSCIGAVGFLYRTWVYDDNQISSELRA